MLLFIPLYRLKKKKTRLANLLRLSGSVRPVFSSAAACVPLFPVVSHSLWPPSTIGSQASPSTGFFQQQYWSGCHFLFPGTFLLQGWDPPLLYLLPYRQIPYHQCHLPCSVSCSVMSDSATPWTVACQAPLFMEFQARILEWVANSSFGKSSQPRDQTHISCIGRQTLYHWGTREIPDGHDGTKN